MSIKDATKWNDIYKTADGTRLQAAKVLADHQHLLPANGRALDAACGLGGNALLLAERGLQTAAWDISQTAIAHLHKSASSMNLQIESEVRDIVRQPPPADSFDIIVVSRFLDRQLLPALIAALRKNGLIFYQTFIRDKVSENGPKNPDYRLGKNELLALFNGLELVIYREEGSLGDVTSGFRNEAMLVAKSP